MEIESTTRHLALAEPQRAAASATASVRARGALLALAALAAAALIGACGSSKSSSEEGAATGKPLEMTRIIRAIEGSILTERHIHATVTCPAHVEIRKGNNFTCYATGTVGTGSHKQSFRTAFTVEQVNQRGYVEYHS
jgi:hypothetical protein